MRVPPSAPTLRASHPPPTHARAAVRRVGQYGGGIYASSSSPVTVSGGSTISGNSASAVRRHTARTHDALACASHRRPRHAHAAVRCVGQDGGGIYADSSAITVTGGSTISRNSALPGSAHNAYSVRRAYRTHACCAGMRVPPSAPTLRTSHPPPTPARAAVRLVDQYGGGILARFEAGVRTSFIMALSTSFLKPSYSSCESNSASLISLSSCRRL